MVMGPDLGISVSTFDIHTCKGLTSFTNSGVNMFICATGLIDDTTYM